MSEVKRFTITWDEAGFRYAVSTPLFEGAEVVRAEDYAALESQHAALKEKAERLEASQGGYRSCYEMVKQFDVYGTGGDVSSCIREMLQRIQELTAGWKKCEDHLKIVATEFLESVDEEFIPHEDRSQATFEDAVKVARQALIHQASKEKP